MKKVIAKTIIIVFYWMLNQQLFCDSQLLRNKRFLIFPRQAPTRHQFIGGIGIPVDLSYESLTIGYVLKAEFWLPYNETVFRENPYFPEYKNDKLHYNKKKNEIPNFVNARSSQRVENKSKLRWDIYDVIIHRLDGYGYKGQECLLRAICEANALQFMRHFDVYGELLHIFFSPSTSSDSASAEAQDFLHAEKLGAAGDSCSSYDCNLSILDMISKVFKEAGRRQDIKHRGRQYSCAMHVKVGIKYAANILLKLDISYLCQSGQIKFYSPLLPLDKINLL